MVRGGGDGRPAKLFTRKESGLQHREGSQGQKREEDDARKLRGEQLLLWGIAPHLDVTDKPGGNKEKDNSRGQHNQKHEIDQGENKATQLFALFRRGIVIKGRD